MSRQFAGERCSCRARHRSQGKPLANVPVDIWHADGDGFYDLKRRPMRGGTVVAGALRHDADAGSISATILPCSYPIPTDGPVGEMIIQTRRHAMRPAHVHFLVNAPATSR